MCDHGPQFLAVLIFVVTNAVVLAVDCSWFRRGIVVAGVLQWTCFNCVFLIVWVSRRMRSCAGWGHPRHGASRAGACACHPRCNVSHVPSETVTRLNDMLSCCVSCSGLAP